MYNDENNLYHYTYRKDGSEPRNTPPVVEAAYREPWEGDSGKKQNKKRGGAKIVALALSCALLGGAAGAGVMWGVSGSGSSTSVNISSRPATAVALKTVDGKNAMTDAELYAANVNSVVSINSTSTTNYFGQQVQDMAGRRARTDRHSHPQAACPNLLNHRFRLRFGLILLHY